jgi:hypothetical protein
MAAPPAGPDNALMTALRTRLLLPLCALLLPCLPGPAASAEPWPEPAMAVGQGAPRWRSFVPKDMATIGEPVEVASEHSPNPVQAILLRRDEQYALLIGTTTGDGRFEAWHWATFMNCRICLDDPTAHVRVRLAGRGRVLSVTAEAASERENARWRVTWRLREREQDGMVELIGLDALTGIEGRQGTRESANLLTGETVTETGTLRRGRLAAVGTAARTKQKMPPARPLADAVEPAF